MSSHNPTTSTADRPPTPKDVLGPYYLLASSEDIKTALKALTFELRLRALRGDVTVKDAMAALDEAQEAMGS